MLRSHPAVIAALAKRGITDLSRVLSDMWAYGAALVPERYAGRRIGWCDVWYRGSELGQPVRPPPLRAAPRRRPEHDGAARTRGQLGPARGHDPQVQGEYLPDLLPLRLREVAPLQVSQPDGVGFTLDGNLLSWQNWQLRLGFNHREGLVLHQVAFRDGGRLRPVAHRLSFAEMVVPYRDASPDHYRRTAFDIGEWGLGFMTTSLALGCDCLGEITYLDAVVHDSAGEPQTIANAICVHEEDSGVLWKHVDERAGAEVRRARRLVVSFHVTVANYEYLVYWRFYQDGAHRVRGPRDRHHGDLAYRRAGQPPGQRDAGRPGHLRPVPPALHRGPARPGRGRDRQHRLRRRVPARAARSRRPVRARPDGHQHPAAHRGGGQAGLRLGHAARLEGRQRQRAQRPRHPGRLQAHPPAPRSRRCSTRPPRPSSGPRSSGTRSG